MPGAFLLTLLLLGLLSGLSLLAPDSWAKPSALGPLATGALAGLLAVYSLCVLGASIVTAAKTEWKLLPVLPPVFACYHFGYGWGFLRGVFDFVLLRRHPANSFTQLTRSQGARVSRA